VQPVFHGHPARERERIKNRKSQPEPLSGSLRLLLHMDIKGLSMPTWVGPNVVFKS